METGHRSVVVVEDDFLIAESLRLMCEQLGMRVHGMAARARDAIDLIRQTRPEWVLMDVRLAGKRDGVDVAQLVHAEDPDLKVVFVTGSNEPPTMARIKQDSPHEILIKPITMNDLKTALLA